MGQWKYLCMATLLPPLSQGFSTLHDIDVFRCCVAEISDNLADDKRPISLCLYRLSRLWLYMALVMVSRVVADGGGCPESELRST